MSLLVSALLVTLPVAGPDRAEPELREVDSCPALFGDDDALEHNAQAREDVVLDVDDTDATIVFTHANPRWSNPTRMTFKHLEILEIDDRLGSLEPGKHATFIVTNGSPLGMTTNPVMAFIEGKEISLESKQSDLAEKYREKYRQLGITRDN